MKQWKTPSEQRRSSQQAEARRNGRLNSAKSQNLDNGGHFGGSNWRGGEGKGKGEEERRERENKLRAQSKKLLSLLFKLL